MRAGDPRRRARVAAQLCAAALLALLLLVATASGAPGEGDDPTAQGDDPPAMGDGEPADQQDDPGGDTDEPGEGEDEPAPGEDEPAEDEDSPPRTKTSRAGCSWSPPAAKPHGCSSAPRPGCWPSTRRSTSCWRADATRDAWRTPAPSAATT